MSKDGGNTPLWPHEVFDLDEMEEKLRELEGTHAAKIQEKKIAKVKAMFEYMAEVGAGINVNNRIFSGSMMPD